jgi:hypothetical protein
MRVFSSGFSGVSEGGYSGSSKYASQSTDQSSYQNEGYGNSQPNYGDMGYKNTQRKLIKLSQE